jgi:hypothetical protein
MDFHSPLATRHSQTGLSTLVGKADMGIDK